MHSQCRTKTLHVKMSLWSQTSRLPRAYNNTRRSRPTSGQSHRFSIKTPIPQVKEGVTKVYWIFKSISKLHTTPFRTTFSVLQTPQKTSKFYVPTNLVEAFTNLNKLLENSCKLALKQPLKNKQLIVMSDASFTAEGYAIMIEDDPNQKLQSKRKTYAPIAFGSKTFNPTQTKMSIYAKEFLSI